MMTMTQSERVPRKMALCRMAKQGSTTWAAHFVRFSIWQYFDCCNYTVCQILTLIMLMPKGMFRIYNIQYTMFRIYKPNFNGRRAQETSRKIEEKFLTSQWVDDTIFKKSADVFYKWYRTIYTWYNIISPPHFPGTSDKVETAIVNTLKMKADQNQRREKLSVIESVKNGGHDYFAFFVCRDPVAKLVSTYKLVLFWFWIQIQYKYKAGLHIQVSSI